jgi:hypothetical protein
MHLLLTSLPLRRKSHTTKMTILRHAAARGIDDCTNKTTKKCGN